MPKHITITFEIENEEFEGSLADLAYNRILAGIARKIVAGMELGHIHDINGYIIGFWSFGEGEVEIP